MGTIFVKIHQCFGEATVLTKQVYPDKLIITERFIQINQQEDKGMEGYKLFDAEYRFMDIVWELEPVNSTQLCRACQQRLGWKKPTTYTVLRKLAERGLLQNENATVTALVNRQQVRQYESQAVVARSFEGSLPVFLTAFLGRHKLTQAEAEELRQIIEEATE